MKTFISIIFLTLSFGSFSQNAKIDSLQQKLTQAKGIDRIIVLNDLAYAYGYVDFNKSISLAKEALLLAETLKYNKAKALTYDILGRAYFISGNYKVAEEYYNKCIITANKYGTKEDIYKALRHKTLVIYSTIGLKGFSKDSTESMRIFKQYLNLTIEIPLKKICLHQIGVIYYKVRKYKESVQYYSEALELLKNNESASNASLISVIDLGLGTAYMQLKNYKTALSYFQKTLDTPYLTIRDKAIVYNDIGQAYLSVDSLDKAELFIDKAIAIYDSLNIKNEKLSALGGKAELLTRKKQWNQLSVVVNKITVLASDVQEYYMLYDCFKFLSNYYENTGNYKKSNEYLKKWITVNDSITIETL